MMLDQEEDDDISLAESLASSMRDPDTTLQVNNRRRRPFDGIFCLVCRRRCHSPLLSVCMLLFFGLLSKTLLYHALRTLIISSLSKLFKPRYETN
jgi:hypothetical protein